MPRLLLFAVALALLAGSCRTPPPVVDWRYREIMNQSSPLPLDPGDPEFRRHWDAVYASLEEFQHVRLADPEKGRIKTHQVRREEMGLTRWYWAVGQIRHTDRDEYDYWVRVYRVDAPRSAEHTYDEKKTLALNTRVAYRLEFPDEEPPFPLPWTR